MKDMLGNASGACEDQVIKRELGKRLAFFGATAEKGEFIFGKILRSDFFKQGGHSWRIF